MILLDGHSLTKKEKIRLESMSLQLKERDSTATISPESIGNIAVSSWLQDDTAPGNGIVWRVKSISQAYATQKTTVQLEHAISTLKDVILFGEVKTETLAGTKGAKTVTAKKAIQYILAKQSDWTLGSFSFTDSNPYRFDGETLYEAITTVSDSLEGAVWSYDFSSYPFKLNITKENTDVNSEMRAGRNIRTITKNIDKSDMVTRIYPIGANDLHISGSGYVGKNTTKYGIKEKVETDNTITTEAELKRWANEYLKKHAQPNVSIDVDGYELADATGEPMDRFTLNRVCRIPLPEFGTEIKEKIVALSYPDKLRNPETVKVSLANRKTDVTKIIAEAIRRGGKGGRASARRDKEDMAWFEDTNDHVAMCAKGIIGVNAKGEPNWTRLSQIIVDGKGIHTQVQDINEKVGGNTSSIEQNEKEIKAEIKARKNGDSSLETKIQANAGKISLVVTSKNGKNSVNTGSIVLAINSAGKSVAKIKASKIDLEGYVTMSEFSGEKGRVDKLISGDSSFDFVRATKASLGNSNSANVSIYGRTVRVYSVVDTNGTTRQVFGYTL